jgi:hypothetical protein
MGNGRATRVRTALLDCSFGSLLFLEALLSIPPIRQKTWKRLKLYDQTVLLTRIASKIKTF